MGDMASRHSVRFRASRSEEVKARATSEGQKVLGGSLRWRKEVMWGFRMVDVGGGM